MWLAGGAVFRGHFDEVVGCNSVKEAVDVIEMFAVRHQGVKREVQWWGHGFNGAPMIGDGKLTTRYHINAIMSVEEIWFRTCYVARGDRGRAFMQHCADVGTSVLAHPCIIGTWGMHSGLVGVKAGEKVWWNDGEFEFSSRPHLPRTISTLRMSVPEWAWER